MHGRPQHKAAALTLTMPRQLVATCDDSPRGRRDRALLLIGFAGALRRCELVALRVEDMVLTATGLRIRIRRGKTDAAGEEAEIGLPRGRHAETCPVRALEAWQVVAKRKAGSLFRRVGTAGGIGDTALHPDTVRHVVRARGHFPADQAAIKLLFLVLHRAEKARIMSPCEWTMAKAQFTILFGERFTKVQA